MSDTQVSVTAEMVKELRERTDAPMMECKKYLVKAAGDMDKAIELMRVDGATKAAKKEGRVTAEGLVAIEAATDNQSAALAEVNCETDFVARSEDFQAFAKSVAKQALKVKETNVTLLLSQTIEGTEETLETRRQALISKLGENITVRRVALINTEHKVASYSHGARIGVLVEYQGDNIELGRDIAMQVAASRPQVVLPSEVSAELIAKEREIYTAQATESGKPAAIIEKMIEGRIAKYLDEVSLVGQPFVKDPDTKVGIVLKQKGTTVLQFVRFEVGEGIEKKVDNFVEEVLAQARGK